MMSCTPPNTPQAKLICERLSLSSTEKTDSTEVIVLDDPTHVHGEAILQEEEEQLISDVGRLEEDRLELENQAAEGIVNVRVHDTPEEREEGEEVSEDGDEEDKAIQVGLEDTVEMMEDKEGGRQNTWEEEMKGDRIAIMVEEAVRRGIGQAVEMAVKVAIQPLMAKINVLEAKLDGRRKDNNHFPELPGQGRIVGGLKEWPSHREPPRGPPARPTKKTSKELEISAGFDLAKRCVGFSPITNADIKYQGYKEEHETLKESEFQVAGTLAARKYLTGVMKLSEECAAQMQISRVFLQNKEHLNNTLFVEVSHASDIAVIRNASANMSNSGDFRPQLEQFVPKCLEAQHKEVVNLAFAGRNEGNEGTSKRASKIWVRKEEFELRFKDKKDPTPWANIQPEQLPTLGQKRKDFNSNLRIQFPMEF